MAPKGDDDDDEDEEGDEEDLEDGDLIKEDEDDEDEDGHFEGMRTAIFKNLDLLDEGTWHGTRKDK